MKQFSAEDGFLHFVFANEDDYYLDSLVCLDFKQYLYYCLKKASYRGVFFLDGTKNDLQVYMQDIDSVSEFPKNIYKGFLGLRSQSLPVQNVTDNNHTGYEIRLQGEDDWYERLENMLCRKQDAYAFVIPMALFYRLFQDEERVQALIELIKNDRQGSIFVVTATTRAENSMDYLLTESGPFCSRLCPEILRVVRKSKKVLLYEEMEQELSGRYQVFNQLERRDILRMLKYRLVVEGKGWHGHPESLWDVTDVIYFWYHSPLFAADFPDLLPENEGHLLSVIAEALDSPRIWQNICENAKTLRGDTPFRTPLAKILALDYPYTRRFHPRREQSSALRRLQRFSLTRLMGEEGTVRCRQLSNLFTDIQEDMQRVYSDARLQKQDDWLDFCLDALNKLDKNSYQDADTVERVLNFLDYLVIMDERVRRPELFAEKVEYYRQIVELSMEIASMNRTVAEYEERARENMLKKSDKVSLILRLEKELPQSSRDLILQSHSGQSFSGEYLSLTAEKKEVVRLNDEYKNLQRLLANKKSKISLYRKTIGQLELSIDELSAGNLTDLSKVIRNATNAVQRKAIVEEKLVRVLKNATDEYQTTQDTAAQEVNRILPGQDIDEEFTRIVEGLEINRG